MAANALNVRWYHSLDLVHGGNINTSDLVGSIVEEGSQASPLGDMVSTITSDIEGGDAEYFYRKVWAKNHEAQDIEAPRVYLSMLSYPGQVAIARSKVAADTSATTGDMPYGYTADDFLSPNSAADAIYAFANTSDLDTGTSVGFWVRLRIPAGVDADDAAHFRLNLFGRPI